MTTSIRNSGQPSPTPSLDVDAIELAPLPGNNGNTGDASSSKANVYKDGHKHWEDKNNARLDNAINKNDKRKRHYWQNKLIGLAKPKHTAEPPQVTFGKRTPAEQAQGILGKQPAENLVSLLYVQKAEWLNPAMIDKKELAHAVHEVLQKKPEDAVDSYLKAIHFPRELQEVKKDLGRGAGHYAHRWKPILFDNTGRLASIGVPFASAATDVVVTLYSLRGAFAALQAYFGLRTGWDRARHFKDREAAAASVIAKTIDILSKAPTPEKANQIGRELKKLAPEIEKALKLVLEMANADNKETDETDNANEKEFDESLHQLGPQIDKLEECVDQINAHLYNKAAEYKGNKRGLIFRSVSNATRIGGGAAAIGIGATTGPVNFGIAGAATFALSQLPHLIYHFTDKGVKDARDKGMARLENNLKMTSQWINAKDFTAQEISDIYDAYTNASAKKKISEEECENRLQNAFNMESVTNLVEVMGGVQEVIAEKLLQGKLSKAIRKMLVARTKEQKAANNMTPSGIRKKYEDKAQRCEQAAERLFEDYYHLRCAQHHIKEAVDRKDTDPEIEGLLDDAVDALAKVQDKDVHTLLTSESLQKQAGVMAKARVLNKDEFFKYAMSYAAGNILELASPATTIGLGLNNAVSLGTGVGNLMPQYYVADTSSSGATLLNPAVSGQRTNFEKAYGKPGGDMLTDAAQLEKPQAELGKITFSDPDIDKNRKAFQATLQQIKANGATPGKLAVGGNGFDFEIDFTETKPFYDEQIGKKSLLERAHVWKEDCWILARLVRVALRAIGTDTAKRHLEATKELWTEIYKLKPEYRETIRRQNFELLTKALNDPTFEDPNDPTRELDDEEKAEMRAAATARLRKMGMLEFMNFINSGLQPLVDAPIKTRVCPAPVSMTTAGVKDWMDKEAGNEDYVVLRTRDRRFVTASRDGRGTNWEVHLEDDKIFLDEFMKGGTGNIPLELGIIPYTYRRELTTRLEDLGQALATDKQIKKLKKPEQPQDNESQEASDQQIKKLKKPDQAQDKKLQEDALKESLAYLGLGENDLDIFGGPSIKERLDKVLGIKVPVVSVDAVVSAEAVDAVVSEEVDESLDQELQYLAKMLWPEENPSASHS